MKMAEYEINHVRHGCYSVILVDETKSVGQYRHLTFFKNKKAAKKFIEAHKKGEVTIDKETGIPTPDFH